MRNGRGSGPKGRLSSLVAVLAAVVICSCGSARAAPAPAPDAQTISKSLEALASGIGPSVVQVIARGVRARGPQAFAGTSRSIGSGVIVSAAGHVITNAHVVVAARQIDVVVAKPTRGDKPSIQGVRRAAKVLAIDVDSDIAVLQVDPTDLRPLSFADSDRVRPGQLVLAVGSPLGLEGTVSMGIVSAVSRQIHPDTPVVFIQTDAPINPGSSGGPLIDAQGRIVGINSFIVSTTGGSQGLGFAVPSNNVRRVFEQIRDEGGVVHGAVGIQAETLTPELAIGLGVSDPRGVLIADVAPGGPADAAGLEPMDQVLSADGSVMETAREFLADVYARRPGSVMSIDILRDGATSTLSLTVGAVPGDPSNLAEAADLERYALEPLGVLAVELTAELAAGLPGLRSRDGVLVVDAGNPGGVADALEPGDVIVAVNRTQTRDLAAVRRALAPGTPMPALVLTIERAGVYRHLVVEPV